MKLLLFAFSVASTSFYDATYLPKLAMQINPVHYSIIYTINSYSAGAKMF